MFPTGNQHGKAGGLCLFWDSVSALGLPLDKLHRIGPRVEGQGPWQAGVAVGVPRAWLHLGHAEKGGFIEESWNPRDPECGPGTTTAPLPPIPDTRAPDRVWPVKATLAEGRRTVPGICQDYLPSLCPHPTRETTPFPALGEGCLCRRGSPSIAKQRLW